MTRMSENFAEVDFEDETDTAWEDALIEDTYGMPEPLVDGVAQALIQNKCVAFTIADDAISPRRHQCYLSWVDCGVGFYGPEPWGKLLYLVDSTGGLAYPADLADKVARGFLRPSQEVLHDFFAALAWELADGR